MTKPTGTGRGGKRAGSGRPRIGTGKMMVVSASVPEELATALQEYMQANGVSRSAAITSALSAMLESTLRANHAENISENS